MSDDAKKSTILERFRDAVQLVARWAPFLSPALYRMRVVSTDKRALAGLGQSLPHAKKNAPKPILPAMAVGRGGEVKLNPDWTGNTETMGVILLHELFHLVFKHHDRCRSAIGIHTFRQTKEEAERSALLAADLEVNSYMASLGFTLPSGAAGEHGPMPQDFNLPHLKTLEFYHKALMQDSNANNSKCHCGGMSGIGATPHDHDDGDEEGDGEGGKKKNKKGDGEGEEPGSHGGLLPGEGGNNNTDEEAEFEAAMDEARKTIASAIGSCPGLDTQSSWKSILAAELSKGVGAGRGSAMFMSTFTRRSRRQSAMQSATHKIRLPGMRGETRRIGVVLDTSGSMSIEQISKAVAAINDLGKVFRYDVYAVPCSDTAGTIRHVPTSTPKEIKEMAGHGRGGTHLENGVRALFKQVNPPPGLVIYLTDGQNSWEKRNPARVPHYCVLIGVEGHFNISAAQARSMGLVPTHVKCIGSVSVS